MRSFVKTVSFILAVVFTLSFATPNTAFAAPRRTGTNVQQQDRDRDPGDVVHRFMKYVKKLFSPTNHDEVAVPHPCPEP